MKLRIISAALLAVCFGWLAVLSGAVPVMAKGAAAYEPAQADADVLSPEEGDGLSQELSAPEDMEQDPNQAEESAQHASEPDDAQETPGEGEETEPGEEEETEPDKTPYEEPPFDPGPELVTLTLTGETLQNDTYYDIDPYALLEEGTDLRLPGEGYQILIIHTHATEAYHPDPADEYELTDGDDYRTTDPGYSVIRVGDELANALSACGLSVLHDTELHDYPSYSGSYYRSGEAIEEYLAAYPGIRIVIDLHRDAIGEDGVIYRTLADIDGVEAAQLMFVMGTDVNLEHPAWQENLKLALALQSAVQQRYPTLMRPTVLCDYRYNQQLTAGSLLLEVGTSGNSLEEALEGVRRFAEIAGPFLASMIEE